MRSTLRKIFEDKSIRHFELDYSGNYYLDDSKKPRNLTSKKDKLIADIIPDGSSVLDIGCSDGRFLSYLKGKKPDINAFGINISEDAVKTAIAREIKAQHFDVASMDIPNDWMFDYIIMADFIEHILDPERLLMKLKNHFKKAIIISIPNTGYITVRLRLLIGGRFPIQWSKHPGEHIRFWTVKDFYWWTDQLGYDITQIIPVRGSFFKSICPNLFSSKNIFILENR